MDSEFAKEMLELLVKHKVVPSSVITELRNLEIRDRYATLKKEIGSMPAKEKLADDFCMGVDNIDKIVYPRNK